MDFHALQHKLFNLDPSDPIEDKKRMIAAAQADTASVPATTDYVNESVEVPQGSMPLGLDSIADFAALAGVQLNEKQHMGSAGQAKGKDPMPATSTPSNTGEQPHPLKDKLVGEHDIDPVSDGTTIGDIAGNLEKFGSDMGLREPYLSFWARYSFDAFMKIQYKQDSAKQKANERTLTKGEENKKEKYVKGMKKNKSDFKDRYGDDAESVMYATATKNAKKNESIKDRLYKALNDYK